MAGESGLTVLSRKLDWGTAALAVTACVASAAFVAAVPAGLPYDEPSHWANVQFYLDNWRVPEIGDNGVTYEAQMGPLAYTFAAVVAWPFAIVSTEAAFYAVRALGALQLLVLALVIWRLARRVMPPRGAVLAAGCVALNPMMLAMSTSVQNDTLALLLSAIALEVAVSGQPTKRRAGTVGLIVGAAVITKITVWPVVLVLGMWLLWRRAWGPTAVYAVCTTLVAGWWFMRNVAVYGDLTGRGAVEAAGYDFPALANVSPVSLGRSVVTYLWLPTEYYRNFLVAPPAIELIVLIATGAGIVGVGLLFFRGRCDFNNVVGLTFNMAVLAFLGWLITVITTQAVAFRFAYVALFLWFLGLGALGRPKYASVVGFVVLSALCVWVLSVVAGLPAQVFEITFV